ncbi:MAG: hypothetical protein M0R03_20160 [Novosphingobium sp.]|nr:hypothetical protein [Novosphingobium sp.]
MKAGTFDLMRGWAALTGLVLALWYFGQVWEGVAAPSPTLPMLVAAIGGFELFLFAQDMWLKRSRRHG